MSEKKKILISGTGGFSKEVLCMLIDLGLMERFIGFIEPDSIIKSGGVPIELLGYPVLPYSFVKIEEHCVALAIGDSQIREKILSQLPTNLEYLSLIHPSVVISKWVEIGKGAIICAGSILTCDIKIGDFAQINLNTTIGHDCQIGDFFTTAPNVNISGNCNLGKHIYFGTSSSIKQGLSICNNVTVGMGAVIVNNINESGIYVGIPASKKKLKYDSIISPLPKW